MANEVTVSVEGGPSATVAFTQGMTALKAMEAAHAKIEPDPNEQFTFALQFYGAGLGYLVSMINETYDSFISRGGENASPFFYWNFLVNEVPSDRSVYSKTLVEGDRVLFRFERFVEHAHRGTLLAVKHRQ